LQERYLGSPKLFRTKPYELCDWEKFENFMELYNVMELSEL